MAKHCAAVYNTMTNDITTLDSNHGAMVGFFDTMIAS